ncbi:MAG: Fic family protein [Niameybacter sp.]
MEYITVKKAAEKWNISDRRVRVLCSEGKIEGAFKQGRLYKIPIDARKPIDARTIRGKEIPEEYSSLFSRIDAKRQELNNRRPLTRGELERLQEEFMVYFTYNSNAIEGNTLTLQETAMVLEGITIDQKPLKEHLEVVGHKEAFLYVRQLILDKEDFTERMIKDIHSLVLMDRREDKGVYRRIPVKIMGSIHEPPQPYLLPIKMEELVSSHKKNQKTLHCLESVARFHMDFEAIHPFVDGNGRTGRLLLNFELIQNGYPPINIKFTDRRKYYETFNIYHEKQDLCLMIEMIATYVEEELDKYLSICK